MPIDHAATIRRRADRAIALLTAHDDLLSRHGIPVTLRAHAIRTEADHAIAHGKPAYGAGTAIHDAATDAIRVSDRLTGTRVHGHTGYGSVITTASIASPDGDNLQRIGNRLLLDVLGDRADDPLFDVR